MTCLQIRVAIAGERRDATWQNFSLVRPTRTGRSGCSCQSSSLGSQAEQENDEATEPLLSPPARLQYLRTQSPPPWKHHTCSLNQRLDSKYQVETSRYPDIGLCQYASNFVSVIINYCSLSFKKLQVFTIWYLFFTALYLGTMRSLQLAKETLGSGYPYRTLIFVGNVRYPQVTLSILR